MAQCSDCNKVFRTSQALHAHCRDRADHAYCEECERLFVHSEALSEHRRNAPVHRSSDSNTTSSNDETPFCASCNRWFVDLKSLYQHLANNSRHNWCFVCSRDFATETSLNQHMSSRVHNGYSFDCPLCSKSFKVPSSIAHHIESGGCDAKITRHQVKDAVHSIGIIPTISISRRLQSSSGGTRTITTYSATELAFNGSTYECYLCHKTFRKLTYLNAHLASPAHDEDEFKCPGCKGKFKLISALVQHIESEACGMAKFKQVEDYATSLTEQFSRLLKF
ncbi:hypothetical protein Hypma_001532 [Hypsizygus marmoreus]|uniref:C2H2-type domain-containing protein n=1 Tax=Hypsizygus marmoreus TaxID=39966 RepID=A0A369K2I4_HYPMA|nr:hypothetical protein Hypma_001532 [Hypsizygus marmoreus]